MNADTLVSSRVGSFATLCNSDSAIRPGSSYLAFDNSASAFAAAFRCIARGALAQASQVGV